MITITLPDSGVKLEVERIAPFLISDIRADILARYPKPKPPVIKVRLGLDGQETEQANNADPQYLFDLQQHRIIEGQAFLESLVEISTRCEIETEKVARLRAWAEGKNTNLPKSDIVLYVTRFALQTRGDVEYFKNEVLGLSQPTEGAIEQSLNTFRPPNGHGVKRPDLQGA